MNKTKRLIVSMAAVSAIGAVAFAVEPTFDQAAGRYQCQRTYRAYLHAPQDDKIVSAQPVFCIWHRFPV